MSSLVVIVCVCMHISFFLTYFNFHRNYTKQTLSVFIQTTAHTLSLLVLWILRLFPGERSQSTV